MVLSPGFFRAGSTYGWLLLAQDLIPGKSAVARASGSCDIKHGYFFFSVGGLCLIISICPSKSILHSSLPCYVSWGLTSINYIACALLGLANGKHWKKVRRWKREKLGYWFFLAPCNPSPGYGFGSALPLSISPSYIATTPSSIWVTVLFSRLEGNGFSLLLYPWGFTISGWFS